jgi:transketolase
MSILEPLADTQTTDDPQQAFERRCVNAIRVLAMDAVQQANSGHPGLPLGAASIAYALWMRGMRYSPTNPQWLDRDRFVLSAGHGSMLLYAMLHLTGYDLSLDDLKRFRQWESRAAGHPEYGLTPGVETTTGPLGQGFANGVGMAITERFLAGHFNQPGHSIIDHYTYALVGDGDLMEGVTAEAASLAGHLGLNKLIYLYDQNSISLAGSTDLSFTENVVARFTSYGWYVQQVRDGNNVAEIDQALQRARRESKRPSLICVATHIGYGSPNKQDTFGAHGAPLGAAETTLTRERLGWEISEPFEIPEDVREHFAQAQQRGEQAEAAWNERMAQYRAAHPALADELERVMRGEAPAAWEEHIPTFAVAKGPMATRKASGETLNAVAGALWNLVGGSADLNPSTNTALAKRGDFQPPAQVDSTGAAPLTPQGAVGGAWGWTGQNIHFGVREHAMGSILNGMATHGGVIPFGATFLVFADYMRPPMRLAALMGLGVTYVFTHDSVAVGEDGPTHQPIEHLASLRAIPNLVVIRPADANETAEAWRVALRERHRPVALALSRQELPIFDRETLGAAAGVARGGYTLAEAPGEGAPADITLIGTGSEVALCLAARDTLAERGVRARVVSLPSWELFDEQPAAYRAATLGDPTTPRLAVEAGIAQGWRQYLGERGAIISIEHFGASAPGPEVLARYGFTVENVVARALALVNAAD